MINTDGYHLLAGDPTVEDKETNELPNRGAALTQLQEDQHRRGRRSAEPIFGICGWYVRAASGLDSPGILANTHTRGGTLDGSYEAALAWGTAWARIDPLHRELFVRRSHIAQMDTPQVVQGAPTALQVSHQSNPHTTPHATTSGLKSHSRRV